MMLVCPSASRDIFKLRDVTPDGQKPRKGIRIVQQLKQTGKSLLAACALLPLVLGVPRAADDRLPIFDTHVHYSRDAWSPYGPTAALEKMKAAGVPRALVSSTPDDGTLRLYFADRDRIVPMLRPYRTSADVGSWFRDQEIVDYVSRRLGEGLYRGIYKGIGEFHLFQDADARTPQMRAIADLAVANGIFLHVHAPAGPVRALIETSPKVKILWAHAGMTEPPDVVAEMLDRYPGLWTEVSFRAGEISSGGSLDPAWRALFLQHRDRVMVGTDTYVNGRWDGYEGLVAEHREWLGLLPPDIARAIAFENAEHLFGIPTSSHSDEE